MSEATLEPITLNELPGLSPWPARLLGLEEFGQRRRTPEHVIREYDLDKYGPLLAAVEREPGLSPEDVKRRELGSGDGLVAVSIGEGLFRTSLREALKRQFDMQVEQIARVAGDAATIVDLGCGYGYLLSRLRPVLGDVELRGGEYAPSAVALAQRLHRDDARLTVESFDFLGSGPSPPLEATRAPALVITSFALHQLPSAAPAVELLHRYRSRIARVVTLEPEEGLFGDSLLGLLRLRYQRINDYSADLLRVLEARGDVEIETVLPNAIGVNALLPGTLSVWRFTE